MFGNFIDGLWPELPRALLSFLGILINGIIFTCIWQAIKVRSETLTKLAERFVEVLDRMSEEIADYWNFMNNCRRAWALTGNPNSMVMFEMAREKAPEYGNRVKGLLFKVNELEWLLSSFGNPVLSRMVRNHRAAVSSAQSILNCLFVPEELFADVSTGRQPLDRALTLLPDRAPSAELIVQRLRVANETLRDGLPLDRVIIKRMMREASVGGVLRHWCWRAGHFLRREPFATLKDGQEQRDQLLQEMNEEGRRP